MVSGHWSCAVAGTAAGAAVEFGGGEGQGGGREMSAQWSRAAFPSHKMSV